MTFIDPLSRESSSESKDSVVESQKEAEKEIVKKPQVKLLPERLCMNIVKEPPLLLLSVKKRKRKQKN